MLHNMKYGSEDLLGMTTKVSAVRSTEEGKVQTVDALADSGASASIISWDLATKVNMVVFEKGEIMVQEEHGFPHKIKVLVSKDLGKNELVVGLEDLKDIGILHKEFPKTLPERRREDAKQFNVQYNSIRGDQWNEQMEVKEKRERARGVMLYLEERYKQVDEKITNLDSFPEEIK